MPKIGNTKKQKKYKILIAKIMRPKQIKIEMECKMKKMILLAKKNLIPSRDIQMVKIFEYLNENFNIFKEKI